MKIIVRLLLSAVLFSVLATTVPKFGLSIPSNPLSELFGKVSDFKVASPDFSVPYDRDEFGKPWADVDKNGCDTRNDILARDLKNVKASGCRVLAGELFDRYSGKKLSFVASDPMAVQVDHIVPLAVAWYSGASRWSDRRRVKFANDPLNLVATSGKLNMRKAAHTPDQWLPPTRKCAYVKRYAKVVKKYNLSITSATERVLVSVCK